MILVVATAGRIHHVRNIQRQAFFFSKAGREVVLMSLVTPRKPAIHTTPGYRHWGNHHQG